MFQFSQKMVERVAVKVPSFYENSGLSYQIKAQKKFNRITKPTAIVFWKVFIKIGLVFLTHGSTQTCS